MGVTIDVNIAPAYSLEFFNLRVRDEILGWPGDIAAAFAVVSLRMTEHGPNLGMPHTRAMKDGLFEIRIRGRNHIARALYCTLRERRIVILHGFIKKSRTTPASELELARKRLKEVKNAQTQDIGSS
jgi:phage-related protein